MSLTDTASILLRIFFPNVVLKCAHDKIRPDVSQAYCPDCGKLIQNEWYITRCSCCGAKMKAIIKNGEIVPQNHFCGNCGGEEYTAEKIERINFIDIKFAVLVKKEVEQNGIQSTTRCWEERTNELPKLPVQYL